MNETLVGADVVDAELVPGGSPDTEVAVPIPRDRQLSPETIAAIAASTAASTRRAYAADREAFTAWSSREGRMVLPASGETMAEWVRHLTVTPRSRTNRPAAPSTIERALSAVTTWHLEQGRPKPNMRGARAVLNAHRDRLAEQKAPVAQPRQATAALPSQIRSMLADTDRTTLTGKRNAALVLLGFATAATPHSTDTPHQLR
ncbi:hypothetical protein [Streptomyces hydrogenans]|uniref:hypothetical protein n=1 Tax=Streptomyces hydrogenans TaxID=1873719 RepID=UPI0035D53A3C